MILNSEQQIVDATIKGRRAIRAFLPTPVSAEDLRAILDVAARAPSGVNIQPWKVYVLTGKSKARLSAAIQAAFNDPEQAASHQEEYRYYPVEWKSPFQERRRKVGLDLYSLLGLGRQDKEGMQRQLGRNFDFFDAPVGLIFTIDRVLEQGSWLDYGTFLQNIMLAARARGLDTCPQAAFTNYHKIIANVLELPANEQLVCGMSLGFADPDKIENSLITEREPVQSFTKFLD
jgi:nitroreductase